MKATRASSPLPMCYPIVVPEHGQWQATGCEIRVPLWGTHSVAFRAGVPVLEFTL